MEPLDSARYLSVSKAKGFLFQFADDDPYIALDERRTLFDEAPAPRAMFLYHTGHALDLQMVFDDRIEWLKVHLYSRR